MGKINPVIGLVQRHTLDKLEKPRATYTRYIYNDFEKLCDTIQPGDLVLVEGRSEMSRIIKFFSLSQWSHVGMYVGDRLIRDDRSDHVKTINQFGERARHMLVEAFSGKGVIASPLDTYQSYNIRLCRPYGITPEDLRTVINQVIDKLGSQYDDQNILDIALMVIQSWFRPMNERMARACLGACNDFQVICSGMIAKAFQSVGYPIVPGLVKRKPAAGLKKENPYGAELIMRHYSQIMPRDFDLSPNFEIIKFNIIETKEPFDYKSLWMKDDRPCHRS